MSDVGINTFLWTGLHYSFIVLRNKFGQTPKTNCPNIHIYLDYFVV
jgi:hypothetical protein